MLSSDASSPSRDKTHMQAAKITSRHRDRFRFLCPIPKSEKHPKLRPAKLAKLDPAPCHKTPFAFAVIAVLVGRML